VVIGAGRRGCRRRLWRSEGLKNDWCWTLPGRVGKPEAVPGFENYMGSRGISGQDLADAAVAQAEAVWRQYAGTRQSQKYNVPTNAEATLSTSKVEKPLKPSASSLRPAQPIASSMSTTCRL